MIAITAKTPKGIWRAGTFHGPKRRRYPDDHFSAEELAVISAEPLLVLETDLPETEEEDGAEDEQRASMEAFAVQDENARQARLQAQAAQDEADRQERLAKQAAQDEADRQERLAKQAEQDEAARAARNAGQS